MKRGHQGKPRKQVLKLKLLILIWIAALSSLNIFSNLNPLWELNIGGNHISGNQISGNHVSWNHVSGNHVCGNHISGNHDSERHVSPKTMLVETTLVETTLVKTMLVETMLVETILYKTCSPWWSWEATEQESFLCKRANTALKGGPDLSFFFSLGDYYHATF